MTISIGMDTLVSYPSFTIVVPHFTANKRTNISAPGTNRWYDLHNLTKPAGWDQEQD